MYLGKKTSYVVFLAAFLMIITAFLTASCANGDRDDDDDAATGEPLYGGVLRIAYGANPSTLDLHAGTGLAVQEISEHLAEYLFDKDINFLPHPGLAESHSESEDRLVHTITLRQGVKFHNGKEMTSEDVVASVERYLIAVPATPEIALFLDEVVAIDKYTVEFRLKQPIDDLLARLYTGTQLVIYPKELCEKYGKDHIPAEEIIGTGPYRLKEFISDRFVHLVRFEDYSPREEEIEGFAGKKHAYADELLIFIVPDQAVRLMGVETGEYHYTQGIEYGEYKRVLAHPDMYPWVIYPRGNDFANVNAALAPTDNVKIRQAIMAAVDVDTIVKAMYVHEELYVRAIHPCWLPETVTRWYTEAGSEFYNQNNPEKAKKLMEEAGYDGTPIIIIGMTEFEFLKNAALILQNQLENVGFNVEILLSDQGTFVARILDPTAWNLAVYMESPPRSTPEFGWTREDHIGWWQGESPRKNQLGEKLRTTFDYEEKFKIWEELHYMAYEEGARIKFNTSIAVAAASSRTAGWMPSGHCFWNAHFIKK